MAPFDRSHTSSDWRSTCIKYQLNSQFNEKEISLDTGPHDHLHMRAIQKKNKRNYALTLQSDRDSTLSSSLLRMFGEDASTTLSGNALQIHKYRKILVSIYVWLMLLQLLFTVFPLFSLKSKRLQCRETSPSGLIIL